MLRVRTDSGSVYDVDVETKRIRRLHGRRLPAQPQDGIWRTFAELDGPVVGSPMVVTWASGGTGATETSLGLRTSTVTEVAEVFPES